MKSRFFAVVLILSVLVIRSFGAEPLSIQQMFQASPKETAPQGKTSIITVRDSTVRRFSLMSTASLVPYATASTPGIVKVGTGLAMGADGKLNNTGVAGVASFNGRGGAVLPAANDYAIGQISGAATVAATGSYNDLSNKPNIPAAQVSADWNASSGVAQILNKPTIPTALSQLSQSSSYRTVTDAEKSAWNSNSSPVQSVFGRTGTVTPQAGDYTAAQVGADALGSATSVITSHESTYNHANLPTTAEKGAMVGTSGTPGAGNAYVTNQDARMSNARTPTAHNHAATEVTSGTLDGDRLPAPGAKRGGVTSAEMDAKVSVSSLGSAAYEDDDEFATAAQGALADTALQPGGSGQPLNLVLNFGAVADGTAVHGEGTDNHDSIYDAIVEAIASGKPLYVPSGIYRTTPISVTAGNNKKLKIYGEGTIYVDDDTTANGLHLQGGTNSELHISGIKIVRYNTDTWRDGAVLLRCTTWKGVTIENTDISGASYWTVYIIDSTNVVFNKNRVHDSAKVVNTDGVSICNSTSVIVTDNSIWDVGDDKIALSSNNLYKAVVANNVLYNTASWPNPTIYGSSNYLRHGIKVSGPLHSSVIANNVIDHGTVEGVGIRVRIEGSWQTSDMEDVAITGNVIKTKYIANSPVYYYWGISVSNSYNGSTATIKNISIANNTLTGSGIGIGTLGPTYGTMKDINVHGNLIIGADFGIKAEYISGLNLRNNTVKNSAQSGIYTDYITGRLNVLGNDVDIYSTATSAGYGYNINAGSTPDKFQFRSNKVYQTSGATTRNFNMLLTPSDPDQHDTSYILPTASAGTLGGVKVGDRLSITDGVLSADVQAGTVLTVREEDGSPTGTPSTLKFSNGSVTDNGDGSFSVANTGGTTDHAALSNLAYATSGHTGFEPTITGGTSSQYIKGDKTLGTLNQAAVAGLTSTSAPTFGSGTTISGSDASVSFIVRNTLGSAARFPYMRIEHYDASGGAPSYRSLNARGTYGTPTSTQTNDATGQFLAYGYAVDDDGAGPDTAGDKLSGSFVFNPEGNFTPSDQPTAFTLSLGKVGGSGSLTERFKIEPNGAISIPAGGTASSGTDRVKFYNVEGDYLRILDEDNNLHTIGQGAINVGDTNQSTVNASKLGGQTASYYAVANGATHTQGTSTTLDLNANDGFRITAASGTVTLTVNNLVDGKYFDIEVISSSGSLSLNNPLFAGATFLNGVNSNVVEAGKKSHYVCKGNGSNTALCYILAESK